MKAYAHAIELNHANADAYLSQAEWHDIMDRPQEALDSLELAKIYGGGKHVHLLLARILAQLGNVAEAVAAINKLPTGSKERKKFMADLRNGYFESR